MFIGKSILRSDTSLPGGICFSEEAAAMHGKKTKTIVLNIGPDGSDGDWPAVRTVRNGWHGQRVFLIDKGDKGAFRGGQR